MTVKELKQLVLKQAANEGLWFDARYITEAYLQEALRRLHTEIESLEEECPCPVCYPIAPAALYKCPVCEGGGMVFEEFYSRTVNEKPIVNVPCRSCNGTGIVK